MLDPLTKALISSLTTLAKKEFGKKRLKVRIDDAVHKSFTEYADICLPLCMDKDFSPELFHLAEGCSIDAEQLVYSGIRISQDKGFGFSKSDIVNGLKQFALKLINVFESITPESGKIPSAFNTFYRNP